MYMYAYEHHVLQVRPSLSDHLLPLDEPCRSLIKLVLSGLTNQSKSLGGLSVTDGQMFLSQVLFQLISYNFMPFISELSIVLWNK